MALIRPAADIKFELTGYGSGDAEELMGAAIAMGIERGYWLRDDLVITTKIFNGTPARWAEGAMAMNRSGLSRKHLYEGDYTQPHAITRNRKRSHAAKSNPPRCL
jgi:hypothetical protein